MSHRSDYESVILTGTTWQTLAEIPLSGSVVVTSQHPYGTDDFTSQGGSHGAIPGAFTTYVENTDYEIDYDLGAIRRKSGGAIPDFASYSSGSYGQFMPWVAYDAIGPQWKPAFDPRLPRLAEKLRRGSALKFAVLGDSITTGGEAERTGTGVPGGLGAPFTVNSTVGAKAAAQDYFSRFCRSLIDRFDVSLTIDWGAIWAEKSDVLANNTTLAARITQQVDVIFVAYGMNDVVSGSTFRAYYENFVSWARGLYPNVEIVIISGARDGGGTGSTRFDDYRTQFNTVAAANAGIAVVDATARWDAVLGRGKPTAALLKNNSNHPTSFGHGLYAEALESIVPRADGTWKTLGEWAIADDFGAAGDWQLAISGYDLRVAAAQVGQGPKGGGNTALTSAHAGNGSKTTSAGGRTLLSYVRSAPSFTKTFTADAIVSNLTTVTKTFTADAIVEATTKTKTFTADAIVAAIGQGTKTFTADAIVEALTKTKTMTADAIVQGPKTATFTADAIVAAIPSHTATFTADAIVAGAGTVTFTADAIVTATPVTRTATFTADAIVAAAPTGAITLAPYWRPGTLVSVYLVREWRGEIAAKRNAGPGPLVTQQTAAPDATVTLANLDPGEYVAIDPARPAAHVYFKV